MEIVLELEGNSQSPGDVDVVFEVFPEGLRPYSCLQVDPTKSGVSELDIPRRWP